MSSWIGTLSKLDLGPGVWVLETDDGERIALYGEVPSALSGQRVRVKGREVEAMGIAMVGNTAIHVQSVTSA